MAYYLLNNDFSVTETDKDGFEAHLESHTSNVDSLPKVYIIDSYCIKVLFDHKTGLFSIERQNEMTNTVVSIDVTFTCIGDAKAHLSKLELGFPMLRKTLSINTDPDADPTRNIENKLRFLDSYTEMETACLRNKIEKIKFSL